MLYAVKGNKQLKIDETEKTVYLNMGYDIAKVEGDKLKTIAASPSKTISYAEHKKILDENIALKEQLRVSGAAEELEKAKAEIKELKKKLSEAEKQLKANQE